MRTRISGTGRILFCVTGALGAPDPILRFHRAGFSRSISRAPPFSFGYPSRKPLALDNCSLADRPRAAPSRGVRSAGGLTLSLHPARASPVLRDGASLTTDSSHRLAPERAAILRAPSTRSRSYSCIRIVKRYRHSPFTSRARWAPLVRVPLFQGPTRGLLRWVHGRPEAAFAGDLPGSLRVSLPRALLATEPCGKSATLALGSLGMTAAIRVNLPFYLCRSLDVSDSLDRRVTQRGEGIVSSLLTRCSGQSGARVA